MDDDDDDDWKKERSNEGTDGSAGGQERADLAALDRRRTDVAGM